MKNDGIFDKFILSVKKDYFRRRLQVVQIGAFNGVDFDPLHTHLTDPKGGWNAVLVEPMPEYFAELQETYKNFPHYQLVNAAIGESAGELEMTTVARKNAIKWQKGCTTAIPPEEWSARKIAFSPDQNGLPTRTVKVPCITFEQLLDQTELHGFDILQIDTEGMDAVILRTIHIEKWMPRIINLEVDHMTEVEWEEICDRLLPLGYSCHFHENNNNCLFYK